jgi:anti-anti-sigma regulatory factor
MYEISEAPWGIEIDLDGELDAAEMREFYDDLEAATAAQPDGFHIYADHRGMETLPDDAAAQFADLMQMCEENGVDRSVVVLDSAITKMQQDRLKREAGIDGQKLVSAGRNDNWEAEARAWVEE